MATYLITNVRILDGTGREPFGARSSSKGPRIAAVTAARRPRPEGATVIDGRGGP